MGGPYFLNRWGPYFLNVQNELFKWGEPNFLNRPTFLNRGTIFFILGGGGAFFKRLGYKSLRKTMGD